MAYIDFDYRGFIVSELEKCYPNSLRPTDLKRAAEKCVPPGEKIIMARGRQKFRSRISWTLHELKESGLIIHDEENRTYSAKRK